MEVNQILKDLIEIIKNESSTETLDKILIEYVKKGLISKEFYEILINLFGITDTVIREVMIPRTEMIAVPEDISFQELIETFKKHKKSKLPVYKNNIDNIVGIIHIKDIIELCGKKVEKFSIKNFLRKPFFVPETKKILDLLKEFKNKKTLFALVVDEFGGISGLVSIVDILEEIVGDFDYEENKEVEEIKQIGDSTFLVDAKMNIEDFKKKFNVKINEGPFDTIGGFIINELGKIPEKGEKIKIDNLWLIVNEAFERGIKNIIVKGKDDEN